MGLASLAAVVETAAEGSEPPAWMFGAGAFIILLLLVSAVTRMNIDR